MKKILSVLFIFIALATLVGCSATKSFADNHFEEGLEWLFDGLELTSDDVEINEVQWYSAIVEGGDLRAGAVKTFAVMYYIDMDLEDEKVEIVLSYELYEDEDGEEVFSEWFTDFWSKSNFENLIEETDEMLDGGEFDKSQSSTGSIRSGAANRILKRVLN